MFSKRRRETRSTTRKTHVCYFSVSAPELNHSSDTFQHPCPELDESWVGSSLVSVSSEHLLLRFGFEVEVVQRSESFGDGGEGDHLLDRESFRLSRELEENGGSRQSQSGSRKSERIRRDGLGLRGREREGVC